MYNILFHAQCFIHKEKHNTRAVETDPCARKYNVRTEGAKAKFTMCPENMILTRMRFWYGDILNVCNIAKYTILLHSQMCVLCMYAVFQLHNRMRFVLGS